MIITKLDIRDFGVFQGEKLEDLGRGIIVIGGANRSGKTSLMELFRNIPFGFTQASKLPPAKFQYDVRCDLLLEDGENANVLLKGFSKPEIVYESDKHNNKSLYNIDKGTYKELFTISLDELNKASGKEDSNLQAMLLGAGFKNIVKIPFVAKELREKANSIGGTRGNPSTKMFKPFTENIKRGVEGRSKSILQLGSFVEKKHRLECVLETIISKEEELQNSNDNLIKLEVLRHYYELNQNKIKLEVEIQTYALTNQDGLEYNLEKARILKSQYIKKLEQCQDDNYFFQSITSQKFEKELLLTNKDVISSFYNAISGIKEICKNVLVVKNEYNKKTQLLMNKIKKANDNWVSFKEISDINCDEVQQSILSKNIESFKKTELDIVICDKKTQQFNLQYDILEKQMLLCNPNTYMKKYFYLATIFMIIGLLLFFIDKLLGSSLIIIGAIGTGLYLFINYSSSKLIINRNVEVEAQMNKIKVSRENNFFEIKSLDENLRELNNIMDEYRDMLKLDGRVSAEGIKEYFKTVAYLKDEIYEYNLLNEKLMSLFNSIIESLNDIDNVLNKFNQFKTKDSHKINLDNVQIICLDKLIMVEALYNQLILAEKAELSLSKLNMIEKDILRLVGNNQSKDMVTSLEIYISQGGNYIEYVNKNNELKIINEKLLQGIKSQRVKRILHEQQNELGRSNNEDENLLNTFSDLYKQYIGTSELNYDYESSCDKNTEIARKLDILKNEKQTLKDELRAMNSDEMLVKHETEIRRARSQLRPLAEKYAVYNTAALFLEKIRERFLLNAKDNLLKDASDILSEITSGEYKDIIPQDDLMRGDFKTKLHDETVKETSQELSRGTKEQLFLAVRISRIKEIKPRLPVILDDSFVNFDIAHTKNTVKALVGLAKSHQIFVLTCHATLVELIMAQATNAVYFKLDKGKFSKSLGEDLKQYLKEL